MDREGALRSRGVGATAGARVRVAASTRAGGFTRVVRPDEAKLDADAAYVHFASNETIHGVQYLDLPRFGSAPHVCDMSSDILWRKIDVTPFSLIYAGAQKNIGPSGVTVVIARRDFVESGRKDLPRILQYRTFVEANSLLNTPPTFGIYLVRNVLHWLKALGGLGIIEQRNRAKAAEIYAAVDARPDFYRCPVEVGSRSVMNAVFRLPTEALDAKFVAEATRSGMVGLKGPPRRRRHPRVALQRRRACVGERARVVHERLCESQRLSRAGAKCHGVWLLGTEDACRLARLPDRTHAKGCGPASAPFGTPAAGPSEG